MSRVDRPWVRSEAHEKTSDATTGEQRTRSKTGSREAHAVCRIRARGGRRLSTHIPPILPILPDHGKRGKAQLLGTELYPCSWGHKLTHPTQPQARLSGRREANNVGQLSASSSRNESGRSCGAAFWICGRLTSQRYRGLWRSSASATRFPGHQSLSEPDAWQRRAASCAHTARVSRRGLGNAKIAASHRL